jgi:hypothetical protein
MCGFRRPINPSASGRRRAADWNHLTRAVENPGRKIHDSPRSSSIGPEGESWVIIPRIDTSKSRNAIAIADGGRGGEVRYLGEFPATEAAIRKLVAKLATKYRHVTFC